MNPEFHVHPAVGGLFKVKKFNANTHELVQETPWINNLVLDAGLNRIATGFPFNAAVIGSGATTPANSQTQLTNKLASTTTLSFAVESGTNVGGGYGWFRFTWRFGPGVGTGTIAELGVSWDGTLCFARALVLDDEGDPTTISKQAEEYLDVTYELREYWPTVDATGTTSSIAWTVRAANVGNWGSYFSSLFRNTGAVAYPGGFSADAYRDGTLAGLGAITTGPDGVGQGSGALVSQAYSNNSYQLAYKATFTPFAGVTQPITAIVFGTPFGQFKAFYNPALAKTAENNYSATLRVTWARKSI